jgi:hypothetical protein
MRDSNPQYVPGSKWKKQLAIALMLQTDRTDASEGHVNIADRKAMSLILQQRKLAARDHVANRTATIADQMLMPFDRVGVITFRACIKRDFAYLTKFVKVVQSVVDGCAADLRKPCCGTLVYLFCGQMYVLTLQRLHNDSALRGKTQTSTSQPLKQWSGTLWFGEVALSHASSGFPIALIKL